MDKYKINLKSDATIKDLKNQTWIISVEHNFKLKSKINLEISYNNKNLIGIIEGKDFTFTEKKDIEKAIKELLFSKYQKNKNDIFYDCIKEDIIYIDKGHEGKIFKSIDHEWVYKIIDKPKKASVNELYQKYDVELAHNEIEKLNNANFPVKKISKINDSFLVFKYKNDILPCKKLEKWDLANLLKAEFEVDIFIDDMKLINFGMRNGKTVYNDIGASFIKTNNKKFKDGLIRDAYFAWKYQENENVRNKIKEERKKPLENHLKNLDFKVFFDYVKNGYLIVALMTTTGERKINYSLKSISGVSNIFIASEIKLKNYNNVFVNSFSKGLARNTMSALAQLKLRYRNANIFVATIDDDDFWKENYILKVKTKIEEGFNFISSWVDVRSNGKKIDSYRFSKQDISIENFIIGNCGVQGSNKVFNLNIALESGGMPMHINSSTDRAFNIELLKHKDIRVGVIESEEVIFNKDTNRNRISNSPQKAKELEKFYKHYRYLIKDEHKKTINKRHEELHGIKEVIKW